MTAGRPSRIRIKPGQIAAHLALLVLIVLSLYPFLFMIITSVKNIDQFYHAYFKITLPFHFENYGEAWNEIYQYIINSTYTTAIAVVIIVVLAAAAGYAFARYKFTGSEFSFMGIVFVMMIPDILSMLPVFVILRNLNLLDTHVALIAVYVSRGQVLAVFIFRNFFSTIPNELVEAAEIDGAGELRTLTSLVLPLSKPIVFTVAIMSTLAIWNEYVWPLITLSTQRLWMITQGLVTFQDRYAGMAAWGPLFAGYVLSSVPLILLFAVSMQYFIAGLTSGAVKG